MELEYISGMFLVRKTSVKMRCVAVLCVLGWFAVVKGQGFGPAGQISEKCFQCICDASTDCDEHAECFSKGPGQYYCGPYQISFDYWKDAGKPGAHPDDPLDFEKCLNSKPCAEATIRGYMYKWASDCDDNLTIDCHDWARIHKTGPYGCNSTWVLDTDYWTRFKACYDTV